jgi:5-methylcytosine-specific restriction protein B
MNTADKSLAQLDLALRRRFSFIETPPCPKLLHEVLVHQVRVGDILSSMNQRIEVLLDGDHLIGHAYFMPLMTIVDKGAREEELARIFQGGVVPLLQEYFFDDWERIRWVLNDHRKNVDSQFIQFGGVSSLDGLFGGEVSKQLTDRRYRVNVQAFYEPEAYRALVDGAVQ